MSFQIGCHAHIYWRTLFSRKCMWGACRGLSRSREHVCERTYVCVKKTLWWQQIKSSLTVPARILINWYKLGSSGGSWHWEISVWRGELLWPEGVPLMLCNSVKLWVLAWHFSLCCCLWGLVEWGTYGLWTYARAHDTGWSSDPDSSTSSLPPSLLTAAHPPGLSYSSAVIISFSWQRGEGKVFTLLTVGLEEEHQYLNQQSSTHTEPLNGVRSLE